MPLVNPVLTKIKSIFPFFDVNKSDFMSPIYTAFFLSILNLLIIIINSIALITLFSGIIVLSGIIDVGKKDKLYEVAILKILGATPGRVAYLWFKEYFIIGLISSVVSLIIGFFVSYILLNYIFNIEINVDYKTIFVLSLLVPFLITLFSLFRMIGLIISKPLVVLRSHF